MTTLLAQHHHFPMDPSPFSAAASGSSLPPSRSASAHPYNEDYMSSREHHSSRYSSAYHGQHDSGARLGAPSSLQISTAASSTHENEPEEQTAHPSRMQTQLQRVKEPEMQASMEVDQYQQASGSASQHSSPSPPASRSGSVSAPFITSFGSFDEGLSRPLTHSERELLAHLDRLKFFLATAPSRWSLEGSDTAAGDPNGLPVGHPNSAHPALNRFLLPNSEYVSCVLWGGLYHITGTDIVRALVFRFEAFGRPVKNMKKFEEGVFSDLRNLKPGVDACLEEPKSPFLDLLFKYQCIRTQKKQKVFYWFSVPHDRLFLDALERDLKREKMGLEPTTVITGEPALSFIYDPKRSLYDQFSKATGGVEGEGELEAAVRRADEAQSGDPDSDADATAGASDKHHSDADMSSSEVDEPERSSDVEAVGQSSGASPSASSSKLPKSKSGMHGPNSPFFSMFSLFEGSPTYKQRRKKIPKHRSPSVMDGSPYGIADGSPDYFGVPPNALPRTAEPQIDRYGRDTTRLSAADMFLAQARGDFGPQSNPDLIASQKERQRRAMQARAGQLAGKGYFGPGAPTFVDGVPHGLRESPEAGVYPSQSALLSNGSIPGIEHEMGRPRVEQRHTYPMMAMSPQQHPLRANTQQFGAHVPGPWPTGTDAVAVPRTKAYVCPLFSCGRMFKRMEHLKRHLRTHTLERPYQCQHCKRRFSRSDHLNLHLRVHLRGADGIAGPEDEADVESEGVDDLEGEGETYINGLGSIPDVQMCEVEIEGQIQEVQGDEEGLLMPAAGLNHSVPSNGSVDEVQEIYYPDTGATVVDVSPEHHSYANGSPNSWNMIRSHPSPAFSTVSMPSPHLGPSYSNVSDFISMSAPAHKATFDHAGLYPTVTELNGPGPIRRHRSATPSVSRYETTRRPFTASEASTTRSYHPYAVAAHSADSSPMAYTVPLGYEASPQMHVSLSRSSSHSRSSSTGQQLQDQMSQMLNLEHMEQDNMSAFAHQVPVVGAPAGYPELYRTDSPMQFASAPASYDVDADAPGMYPMALEDSQPHFASQHVDAGYYSALSHPVAL